MIESNTVAGRQEFEPGMPRHALVRGQSITDACVDLGTTEEMLLRLARVAGASRADASRRRDGALRCTDAS